VVNGNCIEMSVLRPVIPEVASSAANVKEIEMIRRKAMSEIYIVASRNLSRACTKEAFA